MSAVDVAVLPPNIPISSRFPTASVSKTINVCFNTPVPAASSLSVYGVLNISLSSVVSVSVIGVLPVPNAKYSIYISGVVPFSVSTN